MKAEHRRPLSLSMPLGPGPFRATLVRNFFENLLPDSFHLRKRLASQLGVSQHSPWHLLSHLGRDCAGALQLLPEGEYPEGSWVRGRPLKDDYLKKLIRIIPRMGVFRSLGRDYRFCLAGEQDKAALLRQGDDWLVPLRHTPTTHIVKVPDRPWGAENEWLCQRILAYFDLPVAKSELFQAEEHQVLVVERFDRRFLNNGLELLRLPTEDLCQALGKSSTQRYQAVGGPGIQEVMDLLLGSAQANQDRWYFFLAQLLFWMLGALEGHAKNFTLFLERHGRFRLAPCYDVVSSHPKAGFRGALAMSWGKAEPWSLEHPPDWMGMAKLCRFKTQARALMSFVLERTPRVIELVKAELPDGFPPQVSEPILNGLQKAALRLRS